MAGETAHAARAAAKRLGMAGHALVVLVVVCMQHHAVEIGRCRIVPAGVMDLRCGLVRRRKIIFQFAASRGSYQQERDENAGTPQPQ